MKPYTVIGFYRDNENPFIQHVMAKDPKAAAVVAVCSADVYDSLLEPDLAIIEVLEGHHMGVLANEQVIDETEFFGKHAEHWIPKTDLPLYIGMKGMENYLERRMKG